MIAVKFVLDVKTSNPSNASGMASRGAILGAAGAHKKQHQLAHAATIRALSACGVPTTRRWEAERVFKRKTGLKVVPGFWREVILKPGTRWQVELTRLSAGTLDSHDGLRSALKWVVDGIAEALDVDDGDRAHFAEPLYSQRKTPPARKATAFKPARPAVNQVEVLIAELTG